MTAYLVAQFTVKSPDALASYSKKAAPVIASFGGELVFKSTAGAPLDGENPHQGIAVFRFPNKESQDGFHASDSYQALLEERGDGADMIMTGYLVAAT